MQAIMETAFDGVYLTSVITLGLLMIRGSGSSAQYRLFGVMAVVLGCGDAFHLLPRAYALCTTGLENYTVALGLGKWITSVTMTVFYVLLYYVWRKRYKIMGRSGLTAAVYIGGHEGGAVYAAPEPVAQPGGSFGLGNIPEYTLCLAGAAGDSPVL